MATFDLIAKLAGETVAGFFFFNGNEDFFEHAQTTDNVSHWQKYLLT